MSLLEVGNNVESKNHVNENKSVNLSSVDSFREFLNNKKQSVHLISYVVSYRKLVIDQFIFYSFSFLFLFLGCIIYFKTTNWSCSLLISNCYTMKIFACMICLVLAGLAFWAGSTICPKKYAVISLANRAKKELSRVFRQKKLEVELDHSSAEEKSLRKNLYAEKYEEACDRIHLYKQETLGLIEQISECEQLDSGTKDKLFSHMIVELNEKLHSTVYRT